MAGAPPGLVVTGISANHVEEVMGFISSAQRYTPDSWQILVYELADSMPSRFAGLCRVQYRRPRKLPPIAFDRRFLTNSAWKPLVILESVSLLAEGGLILYGDASTRLTQDLLQPSLLNALASAGGVLGRATSGDVAHYTHPHTFAAMGNGRSIEHYHGVPIVCGCVSLWQPTAAVLKQVLEPWAACAAQEQCIKPAGADGFKIDGRYVEGHSCRPGLQGHCHRGDQSVLSILLHDRAVSNATRNGSAAPGSLPYLYSGLDSVVRTERGSRSSLPLRQCAASIASPQRAPSLAAERLEQNYAGVLDVVVAHCTRSLSWLLPLCGASSVRLVHVISKCGRAREAELSLEACHPRLRVQAAGNVGREGESFVRFVVERWEQLANTTLFLQDDNPTVSNAVFPTPARSSLDALAAFDFLSMRQPARRVYASLRWPTGSGAGGGARLEEGYSTQDTAAVAQRYVRRPTIASALVDILQRLGVRRTTPCATLSYFEKAQFVASRRTLRSRPLNFWVWLRSRLQYPSVTSSSASETGHALERLWAALLGCPAAMCLATPPPAASSGACTIARAHCDEVAQSRAVAGGCPSVAWPTNATLECGACAGAS